MGSSDSDGGKVEAKRRVLEHLRMLGREMGEMSRAVSTSMGLHHTQLRAIEQLLRRGRMTPSELSQALGISTGSTTSLIDHLEKMGHLRRLPHLSDRRKVVLEVTDHARQEGGQAFRALGSHLAGMVEGYTEPELVVVDRFLGEFREAVHRHGAEVARRPAEKDGDRPEAGAPPGR